MAFAPPTFNLTAHIWRLNGVGGNYAAPAVVVSCNLALGRRQSMPLARSAGQPSPWIAVEVLFPKLTDVRALWNGVVQDVVEVPAGSKRFYTVNQVEDVGKGFPNEYRLAIVMYQTAGNLNLVGGPFPAPVPLP